MISWRARPVLFVVGVVVVVVEIVVVGEPVGVVVVVVVVEGCVITTTLSLGGCWKRPRISMNFFIRSRPDPTSCGAGMPEALRP